MIRIAAGMLALMGLVGAAQSHQLAPIQAHQLAPMQAQSIELGGTTGVAYYTVGDDGFRVVATLATGEAGAPVRFIATLTPGQSVVVSVPQALHETASQLEIKRDGDIVTVSEFRPAS
jgi:hypothetical protein